jgi:hypothetical protein
LVILQSERVADPMDEDAVGAEATAVIARRDAESAFKGPAEDIAARMRAAR